MENNKPILLGLKDLQVELGYGRTYLYNLRKRGLFPDPISAKKWSRKDIEQWVEQGMPSAKVFNARKNKLRRKAEMI